MAIITVQNYYTNGYKINPTNLNSDYDVILSGLKDGSKDIRFSRLDTERITAEKITVKNSVNVDNLKISTSNINLSNKLSGNKIDVKSLSLSNSGYAYTLDSTETIRPIPTNRINIRAVEYNGGSLSSITLDSDKHMRFSQTSSVFTITIPAGVYTSAQMCTELQTALNAKLAGFTVTYTSGRYTISRATLPILLRKWNWDVTYGNPDYVKADFLLPYLGFKWDINYSTESLTHTSEVDYQVHYHYKLSTINTADLYDGQVINIGLDSFENSNCLSPVIVSLYGGAIKYDVTRLDRIFLIVRKNTLGSNNCVVFLKG
jgi:hypothetical protein